MLLTLHPLAAEGRGASMWAKVEVLNLHYEASDATPAERD